MSVLWYQLEKSSRIHLVHWSELDNGSIFNENSWYLRNCWGTKSHMQITNPQSFGLSLRIEKRQHSIVFIYRELIYIQIHKLIWVWLKQNSLNNTKWQQMLNWSYRVVMNDAWMKIDLEWIVFIVHVLNFCLFFFRFEDGTIPFLDIIAVRHGLDALKKIGGKAIKILHFMTQL